MLHSFYYDNTFSESSATLYTHVTVIVYCVNCVFVCSFLVVKMSIFLLLASLWIYVLIPLG